MDLLCVFADNVRRYRIERNLSQEELAELSNLNRTYISAVERRQRNISLTNLQRIANALQVEPYILLIEGGKHDV